MIAVLSLLRQQRVLFVFNLSGYAYVYKLEERGMQKQIGKAMRVFEDKKFVKTCPNSDQYAG